MQFAVENNNRTLKAVSWLQQGSHSQQIINSCWLTIATWLYILYTLHITVLEVSA